jgi:inner membrane protein
MAYRRCIVRALALCAASYLVSLCAAEPGYAWRDMAAGAGRVRLQDAPRPVFYRSYRRMLDPYPGGYFERVRRPDRPPVISQPGNDRLSETPLRCAASCAIINRVETVSVGNVPDHAAPAPSPPSIPPLPANAFSVSVPASGAVLFAGENWFVLAGLLLLGAILTPGAVVFWFFGLAGFVVGGTLLLVSLTWQFQLISFALLGIVLVVLWARLDRARWNGNGTADLLAHRSDPCAFVGRVFKLQKPIESGIGMVMIGDIIWRVAGKDCAAGKRVKVLYAEGTLLIVDPLEC